jgi:Dolichyl-phosphate-mannose-protein mannosyltransferase
VEVETQRPRHAGVGGGHTSPAARPAARLRTLARRAGLPGLVVAALTVLGLALRLVGLDQSLFGDELSTYASATIADGPGEVIDLVVDDDERIGTGQYVIELTPPLFFVLSWVTAQFGDSTETVRIPSLVAGTLTIPLVYVLGLQTVGRNAAIVGATLTALSPFLIFYSDEARAFALAILVVLLSTLSLLRALEARTFGWWAAYAVASSAAVYTHYTAVFPLFAQFAWAAWFHRDAVRSLLVANAVAAVGFLPWLPEFFDDGRSPWNVLPLVHPFSLPTAVRDVAEWSIGHPLVDLDTIPGELGLTLIGLGTGAAALALAVDLGRKWSARGLPKPSAGLALVVILAASCPLGMIVWSALGTTILDSRNMVASSPGLALAAGALLTAPRMPLRAATVALVVTGLTVGLVEMFDRTSERADYRAAAAFIEDETRPEDPILEKGFLGATSGPLAQHLAIYLPGRTVERPDDIPEAAAGIRGGRVVVVTWVPEEEEDPHAPALPPRFTLLKTRKFRAAADVVVFVFQDSRDPRAPDRARDPADQAGLWRRTSLNLLVFPISDDGTTRVYSSSGAHCRAPVPDHGVGGRRSAEDRSAGSHSRIPAQGPRLHAPLRRSDRARGARPRGRRGTDRRTIMVRGNSQQTAPPH